MFDDTEYQRLKEVYLQCIEEIKEYRRTHDVPLSEIKSNLYKPLFEIYEEISDVEAEFEVEEIMRRHYLSRWKD